MAQLHVTKVNFTDKNKAGELIRSKEGKVRYKVGILTEEYGTKWINGFLPFPPDRWEGTTQELEIFEDEKWGTQFKLPEREDAKGVDNSSVEFQRLNIKLDEALTILRGLQKEKEDDDTPIVY